MGLFGGDIAAFRAKQEAVLRMARQTAALQLICGIDLERAVRSEGQERAETVSRLKRLIERERLKGQRRHWSYDLNRHIALKQALDRLLGASGPMPAAD